MPPMTHPSRPVLAIDTAKQAPHRHPNPVQQQTHRDLYSGDSRAVPTPRALQEPSQAGMSNKTAAGS